VTAIGYFVTTYIGILHKVLRLILIILHVYVYFVRAGVSYSHGGIRLRFFFTMRFKKSIMRMKIKFLKLVKLFSVEPETQFDIGPDSLEFIKYDFYIKIVSLYCILFKYVYINYFNRHFSSIVRYKL